MPRNKQQRIQFWVLLWIQKVHLEKYSYLPLFYLQDRVQFFYTFTILDLTLFCQDKATLGKILMTSR